MINLFQTTFNKTKMINTANTNKITPANVHKLYKKSIYVPIGRGNISLESCRLVESIVSGAIPVMMASEEEILQTFNKNKHMPIIIFDNSWQNVIRKCSSLLTTPDILESIAQHNFKWWIDHNLRIINKIKSTI